LSANGPREDVHVSSAERLYDAVRERILVGDLPPGTKITEAALASAYGVNRAPIREALLRLEERRLIERVPFSGTHVFDPSPEMIRELFEIRTELEALACRRAARVVSVQQAAELEAFVRESEAQVSSMDDAALMARIASMDVHLKIAEVSGNRELQRILRGDIWQYLRMNYRMWNKSADLKRRGVRDHIQICSAICAGDGELAELLMRRHVANSQKSWEAARAQSGVTPVRHDADPMSRSPGLAVRRSSGRSRRRPVAANPRPYGTSRFISG
jgi:DNA-binding GntR family transcriptional regulator